jgi:hypothetical protein
MTRQLSPCVASVRGCCVVAIAASVTRQCLARSQGRNAVDVTSITWLCRGEPFLRRTDPRRLRPFRTKYRFVGAILFGANLRGTNLRGANLATAFVGKATRRPGRDRVRVQRDMPPRRRAASRDSDRHTRPATCDVEDRRSRRRRWRWLRRPATQIEQRFTGDP